MNDTPKFTEGHEEGDKLNPLRDVFLEFPNAMLVLASTTKAGLAKHGRKNWLSTKREDPFSYHLGKIGRHLLALELEGQWNKLDDQWHMAQVAWNAMAYLEHVHRRAVPKESRAVPYNKPAFDRQYPIKGPFYPEDLKKFLDFTETLPKEAKERVRREALHRWPEAQEELKPSLSDAEYYELMAREPNKILEEMPFREASEGEELPRTQLPEPKWKDARERLEELRAQTPNALSKQD